MSAPVSPHYVERAAPATCSCPACTRRPRRGGYCATCAELCVHGVALCVDLDTGIPRPAPKPRPKPQATVPDGAPIAEHARRVGRSEVIVARALQRAGLHEPRRGNSGAGGLRFTVEVVDAALAALDAERPTPTPPPPAPVEAPTPAAPSVECVTCVSWRECTGNRRARCRWCRDGAPPWDGEQKPVATRRYTRRPAP